MCSYNATLFQQTFCFLLLSVQIVMSWNN